MKMNKYLMLIIIILFIFSGADNKSKWKYNDYDRINYKNFRTYDSFLEEIDFKNIDYPRLDAAVFFVTNETRVKNNLDSLKYSSELERSAWNHSKSMVKKKFFSHYNPYDNNRKNPDQRAKLAGVSNPYIAENIANSFAIKYKANTSVYPVDSSKGTFSYEYGGDLIPPHTYLSFADSVVEQWMNSSGHRANILSEKGLQLGCGVYFYNDKGFYNMPMFMATQNFQWFQKIIPSDAVDPDPE